MTDLISLDEFRKKKEEQKNQPVMGYMVWLFCPKCKSIEYSEIVSPYGRVHLCGTSVEEKEVQLDLRAELTLTLANINLLETSIAKKKKFSIRNLTNALRETYRLLLNAEKQYAHRLQLAAYNSNHNQPLIPYKSIDLVDKAVIQEITPMGLYFSTFRYKPEKNFL